MEKIEGELKKELSFDLYGRYAVMRDIINRNRKNNQVFQVLDVGGRGNLMKRFLPKDKVFYLDPFVDTEDENYIKGDGCAIPLKNENFDWVVSADVFEHIPEEKRDDFLSENLRVAKSGVILAAPFFSKEVEKAEIIANENYKILSGGEGHIWLKEHIENGLPSEEKVEKFIASQKLDFQKIHNNRLFLWEVLINLSFLAINDLDEEIKNEFERFNYFYNTEVFSFDALVPSYRKIYFIKKDKFLDNLDIKEKPIDDSLFLETIGKALGIAGKINFNNQQSLSQKSKELENMNKGILEKEREIKNLDDELIHIKASKLWKMREKYVKIKSPLAKNKKHFKK